MAIASAIAKTELERSRSEYRKLLEIIAQVFVEYIPRDQVREAADRFWFLAEEVLPPPKAPG